MKNYLLLLALLTLVFAVACDKDDDDHDHDDDHTELMYHAHIMMPDTSDKHVDDEVHIHINFEEHSGETIHHINVQIYNVDTPSIVIYNKPTEAHLHETSGMYEYHDDVVLSGINGHTDWILEAKIWGAEAGESEVTETVQFHVHH